MNLETANYNSDKKSFTDEKSFSKFYQQYQNLVYRVALNITYCPSAARDIRQDVFLKLWIKRHEIDPVKHLGGYVYNYARFRALNFLQENKKHRDYSELDSIETGMEFTEPHESIEARQVCETIHKVAKKRLPQRCKLVYRLTIENDVCCHEIAKAMGTTLSTVKNQKVRAIRLIKQIMGSEIEFASDN